MIRQATFRDVPLILDLAASHHAASGAPGRFDGPTLALSLGEHVLPGGGCFVSERGVIAGMVAPLWYARDYLVALEWFWWAEDGSGRKLLAAFEAWAWDAGADEIRMSGIEQHRGGAVARLLRTKGYAPFEASYRRALA